MKFSEIEAEAKETLEILEHDEYFPFKKEDNIRIPQSSGNDNSLFFGSDGISSENIKFSMDELPYKTCFASDIDKDDNKRSIIYLIAVQDVEN